MSDAAAGSTRNPFADGAISHPRAYRTRRFFNWFPLGLAYALLYMGRYNLTVAKGSLGAILPPDDFGYISAIASVVYAGGFFFNGPITDRYGGRRAMLIALSGAFAANLAMGFYVRGALLAGAAPGSVSVILGLLYAINMYFQSFGAIAIIKVNAAWFHVRERGGFSGIFGIMISLGLFFAYDVNERILQLLKTDGGTSPTWWVFFAPAACIGAILLVEALFLRDTPGEAGHVDIETGAAHHDDDDKPVSTFDVLARILSNPVILTVAAIEFCTGAIRDGTFQWLKVYAHAQTDALKAAGVGVAGTWAAFLLGNQGAIQTAAGIVGGNFAGWLSDKVFGSRRAPAATLLYILLIAAITALYFFVGSPLGLAMLVFGIAIGVIGTHGLLSGTATMDFGGKKGTATAVGLIDGCVYLGVGCQYVLLGRFLKGATVQYADGRFTSEQWSRWPLFLLPFSVLGLVLLLRIWHAIPKGKKSAH